MQLILRMLMVLGVAVSALADLHNKWILNRFWPDPEHFQWMLGGIILALVASVFFKDPPPNKTTD